MDGGERFGPYRIERLLGRGGMGEVYRAYDESQKRVVALKVLSPHLAADEGFRARFRRESELAARLSEAHVIPIHRYGEIDGRLFIDMRLVAGADLGALIEQRGALPPERAVALVSQVARALDAAHADGLIHRDVKPSNVLVSDLDEDSDDDFVYLVDFGIARATEDEQGLTKTGSALGSFDYMAPERFLEGTVDRRTDVYSLACLLYECLTGRRPFLGEGLPALMYGHLNTPPPRPSAAAAGVPPALDEVIARGMSKDPDGRFPRAGDFASAARRALRGGLGAGGGAVSQPGPAVGPGVPAQSNPGFGTGVVSDRPGQDSFLGSYVQPGPPSIPGFAQLPQSGPGFAGPGPSSSPGFAQLPISAPLPAVSGPPPLSFSGPVSRPDTGAGAGPRPSRLTKNRAILIVAGVSVLVAVALIWALLLTKSDPPGTEVTSTQATTREPTSTEPSSSERTTSQESSESAEPTPEQGLPPAAGSPAPVGGADPAIDALSQGCFAGDLQACDDLYAATANGSPPMPTTQLRPYFDYAFTCGDRLTEDEVARRFCVDIWPDA